MGSGCSKEFDTPTGGNQGEDSEFNEQHWTDFIKRHGVTNECAFYIEAKKFAEAPPASLKETKQKAKDIFSKYFEEEAQMEIGLENFTKKTLLLNMKHIKQEGTKVFTPAMREVMHVLEPQFQEYSRATGIPVMQLKAEAGYLGA